MTLTEVSAMLEERLDRKVDLQELLDAEEELSSSLRLVRSLLASRVVLDLRETTVNRQMARVVMNRLLG